MIITNDEHFLRQKSRKTSPRECKNKKIFEMLENSLVNAEIQGLGLSAIQIGIPIKACIIRLRGLKINMINPTIVKKYDKVNFKGEGCLSFPYEYINTTRYNNCIAEWINEKGEKKKGQFHGLEAMILQHEIDHLEGILFYDRKLKPYVRKNKKVGRNSPCPCDSGKKYKKCCGR